jgi:hypothetical protein
MVYGEKFFPTLKSSKIKSHCVKREGKIRKIKERK